MSKKILPGILSRVGIVGIILVVILLYTVGIDHGGVTNVIGTFLEFTIPLFILLILLSATLLPKKKLTTGKRLIIFVFTILSAGFIYYSQAMLCIDICPSNIDLVREITNIFSIFYVILATILLILPL